MAPIDADYRQAVSRVNALLDRSRLQLVCSLIDLRLSKLIEHGLGVKGSSAIEHVGFDGLEWLDRRQVLKSDDIKFIHATVQAVDRATLESLIQEQLNRWFINYVPIWFCRPHSLRAVLDQDGSYRLTRN